MYIVLTIIAFSVIIAVHELGHFIAARLCNVRVTEFAIGMGPKILKKQGKETLYTIRAFPIGGFCNMQEDTADSSPRAFTAQPRWKRLIILAAGSFMNFILGVIITFILVFNAGIFVGTTVESLADGFPDMGDRSIVAGDTIVAIDGHRTFYSTDFVTYAGLSEGNSIDITLIRNGKTVKLKDVPLEMRDYTDNGVTRHRYGITFNAIEPTLGERLKYTLYTDYNFIRMTGLGFRQLFSGSAGLKDLSGPVGIVDYVNDIGKAENVAPSDKVFDITWLFAYIAVTIGLTNLLPLPALDGGRIFAMPISYAIEKISRKPLNPKYEGYIHAAGLILLFGIMLIVTASDILKLFG